MMQGCLPSKRLNDRTNDVKRMHRFTTCRISARKRSQFVNSESIPHGIVFNLMIRVHMIYDKLERHWLQH